MLVAPRPRSRVISRNLNSLSLQNLCRGRSITAAALHAAIYALICCARQQLLRPGTTRSSVRSVFCQRLSSKWPILPVKSIPISPKVSPGFVSARFRWKTASRAEFARVFPSSIVVAFFAAREHRQLAAGTARKIFRSAGYIRTILGALRTTEGSEHAIA